MFLYDLARNIFKFDHFLQLFNDTGISSARADCNHCNSIVVLTERRRRLLNIVVDVQASAIE